jgi:hypothetical protein
MRTDLPDVADYFPIERGRYDVSPGLFQFGTDFGNGAQDRKLFQIDREFDRYRQNKLEARSEDLTKYYRIERYARAEGATVAQFIIMRLAKEYPQYFSISRSGGTIGLACALTNECLRFDQEFNLVEVQGPDNPVAPAYVSALDALACQVQEDLSVISARSTGEHWVSAIHACAPNYWSPAEKAGQGFAAVHAPVAGMEQTNRAQQAMVDAMIFKGPYVRFTWGLTTDRYLNHHPNPAPGHDPLLWRGRHFSLQSPHLYLRAERQVSWGFPEIGCALFTIRTYLTDCAILKEDPDKRKSLVSAIDGMSDAQLAYKGLVNQAGDIINWLRENG